MASRSFLFTAGSSSATTPSSFPWAQKALDEDPLRKIDFTYFNLQCPRNLCFDQDIQNAVKNRWEELKERIDASSEEKMIWKCPKEMSALFQKILKTQPKVALALVGSDGELRIKLHLEALVMAARSVDPVPKYDDSQLLSQFLPVDTLDHSESRSCRFYSPDSGFPIDDVHYMEKILEILHTVRLHLDRKERRSIVVPAWGYDRLMLKEAVHLLIPEYVGVILPEPCHLKGGIYLRIKDGEIDPSRLLQKIEMLNQGLSRHKSSLHSPLSTPSLTRATSIYAQTSHSDPSIPSISNSFDLIYDQEAGILSTHLAYYLQHIAKRTPPDPDDVDQWMRIWKNFLKHPLLISTLTTRVHEYVLDRVHMLSQEEISTLSDLVKSDNLPAFLEKFSDVPNGHPFAIRKWAGDFLIPLFYSDCAKNFQIKKLVFELAALKCQLEMKKFVPPNPVDSVGLNSIPMEQVYRCYFPGGPSPLSSIWINGRRFPPLTDQQRYYYYLVRILTYALGQEHRESVDCELIRDRILKSEELDPAQDLLLSYILKAGSFSCWGHADSLLRTKTAPLFAKNYQIKFRNPQESPTVEFFVAKNGEFKTIRTGTYDITKNGSHKGEFAVKWVVSYQAGKWDSYMQIPSISLSQFCGVEEQKEIYKGFDIS